MARKRVARSAGLKAKAALAAVSGSSLGQVASRFGVHPTQVAGWKKRLLEGAEELFADGRRKSRSDVNEQELYEQIGRLQMELAWLKKKLPRSSSVKRSWIEAEHPDLSVRRQCELLALPRSTCYYQPGEEAPENLALMRAIDELYLKHPFYGSRKMALELGINRKRAQRLMRRMGLEAVCPKLRTTRPAPGHKIYPYLLRNVPITRPDQVWSMDITYLPLAHGYLYLTAVLDWYSRYVLAWRLSTSLEGTFCLEALDAALAISRPEIFNTDQGSQFTATAFTGRLEQSGIAISMDGRGRALDNAFIERLWRTVKYEEVYLQEYTSGDDALASLKRYWRFYNQARKHQSLGYRTPADVYFERCSAAKARRPHIAVAT